jgi:hypothetical protein
MKHYYILVFAIVVVSNIFAASEPKFFDTKWISSKPEMLTYKSTSKQGDGLYQVSIAKGDSTIEIYMNIITNGFTKTVSGTMTLEMVPLQSKGKIIVNGRIIMETECSYEKDKLHIATLIKTIQPNDEERSFVLKIGCRFLAASIGCTNTFIEYRRRIYFSIIESADKCNCSIYAKSFGRGKNKKYGVLQS